MKLRIAIWTVALLVCGIDIFTKWLAIETLSDGHSVPILGDLLSLKLVYNEGAALSILGNFGMGISIIMILILLGLIWFHVRVVGWLGVAVFGMAIGGALGNLYDRFSRGTGWGRGPVIDMINYGDFFIGNVADIAIVLAAALVIFASWRNTRILRPRKGDGAAEGRENPRRTKEKAPA